MILELRQTVPVGPPGLAGACPDVAVPQASGVACITVSRRSPSDAGIREIFVSVDGERVAVLMPGEAVTHEVPAGPHRIRVHNTLVWKTRDLVLRPGEHVRYRAINRAGWASFGFLILLGAAPLYLTFERE